MHGIRTVFFAGALATAGFTMPAKADEVSSPERARSTLGTRGTWTVTLERLLDVSHHTMKFLDDAGGTAQRTDTTRFQAFEPTLAVDTFPIEHLSIGLRGRYELQSGETDIGGSPIHRTDSQQVFSVDPRVGFAYSWPSGVGLWAIADLELWGYRTKQTFSAPTPGSTTYHTTGLAFGGALLATYTVTDHVFLTAGPWFERRLARLSGKEPLRDDLPFGFAAGAGVRF